MKKIYALAFSALTVATATAADFTKLKPLSVNLAPQATGVVNIEAGRTVAGYYDATSYDNVANYYTILSNSESAVYDSNTGMVNATSGWVISLDFYADPTSPIALPAGTYKAIEDPYPDSPESLSVISDYSFCQYYDATGQITVDAEVKGDVTVTEADGIYTVTATAYDADGTLHNINFSGKIPYIDPSESYFVYRQITEDRKDEKFVGGMAFFYGTTLQTSKGGEMMIQLYSDSFNEENGMQYDGTTMICLDIVGRPFLNAEDITIDPGTYPIVPAGQVTRGTAIAGREITYMSQTVGIGTYLRDRDSQKYSPSDPMAYGHLASGDIVIEKTDKGYKISLENGRTNLGYEVTFEYEGPISPILDYSEDPGGSFKSTIKDDVDMKLYDLPLARVYDGGIVNGNQTFLFDIGSRSGKDPERDNGGDIIRLHFVTEPGSTTVPAGTYTVMSERWDTYYLPGTLAQSHYVSTDDSGVDISGTTYMHFEEGRTILVMDEYAWITQGTVGISLLADDQPEGLDMRKYHVNMALTADNNFYVNGTWEGPAKLMYNPDNLSAIGAVEADGSQAKLSKVANGVYQAVNYNGSVQVYNISGTLCGDFDANQPIDLTATPAGIYIVKMGRTTVKIAK